MQAKHKIKIHLLFISLEALNRYSLQKYQNNYFVKYSNDSIQENKFLIWPLNFMLKKLNYDKTNSVQTILTLIYIVYIISNYKWINNLTKIILFKNHRQLFNKYIYRFTYIYYKTYNYYYNKASNTKFDIEQIAITNLYVIKKIINQKNILYLINYLFI